jgi:exoribonuclease R
VRIAAVADGLRRIREQFHVPVAFPAEVEAAARDAASRAPGAEHRDRTSLAFATLDPVGATDLDQAFAIEPSGADLILHYAIADVAWFVAPGDPVDREAWTRGVTTYLPDGRAPLYPPVLSEGAMSLLPGVDRPAIMLDVRIDPDGEATLQGAERARIRSRAKLAYETLDPADLPDGLAELAKRVSAAEDRRGASRVETPEQEIESNGDGDYHLVFRPRLATEDANATMSLAANLAVAATLYAAGTGIFRTMPEPDAAEERRLRVTARALGLDWPQHVTLHEFESRLHTGEPSHDAFALAVRRATRGATYSALEPGVRPWHAAMAATYAHATAPMRRLADRFVLDGVLALANGSPVSPETMHAYADLPEVMRRAEARAGQVERAALDLIEAAALSGREGQVFGALVTDVDERGARIQLKDMAVTARVDARHVAPGDAISVRLLAAEVATRTIRFERVA